MIHVRKATANDVARIVEIHCDAFADFFLTSLGPSFLQFYYLCFIQSRDGVVMCAEENNEIVGFSATTKRCSGFNTQLIKDHFVGFALVSIKLLVTHPKSLIRLVKNMTKTDGGGKKIEDYAELYSIAVRKEGQGKGVGKKLLYATETLLKEESIKQLSLTTDYNNNEATIAFYQSLNFEVLYEFITYPERKMYRLIKEL